MVFKKPTQTNIADKQKASSEMAKKKRKHCHIILNAKTHRGLKMWIASEGGTICELIEDLAYRFLKEHGKIV